MGFGQSKKKESLESVPTDRGSRSDRGSKHSSNHSDDSERFVSPPTSLVNGFNNFFEFPSRSQAFVKPTPDYHDEQDGVTQCSCHTKTVPRPSTTFQDKTTKQSSNSKSSATLPKSSKNQVVKDVQKTNQVNNQHCETQPNKPRPICGNITDSDTTNFGKGCKDKPQPTASSIRERPDQRQHFNVERRQDGQQNLGQHLPKGTQPSELGQQRLQQRQQQKPQTVPQQSRQQQTQRKHQEKVIQPNQQVHQHQALQQNQKVLSTSNEEPQQLGKQKPSQQQHKQQMQEPNLQQTNHQFSKEQVHLQQQQRQAEHKEKQHMSEEQKLQLKVHPNQPGKQKQPKQEKPHLVQQQPQKQLLLQQKHSESKAHLQNQQQNEVKLQHHNNVLDQQQQQQHNLKQKQTKLPQCQPQQHQHQDKQLPTALLQQQAPRQDNQLQMQSQAQQQQHQLKQQQQKEKLPAEKPQKKGKQQEKLPPSKQPIDQQRTEDNLSSKKTKKLSKKEQRAIDLKQKQDESNQCDPQQPKEKQLDQQSQKLNNTDLSEQNARPGKEEPRQSTKQVQGTAEPQPHQLANQPRDTQEQEQPSNKVAITVRLTYEADNKNSAKHGTHHVVEDTLKGKPIPLMAITFPKHAANCTLRTSKLQATMERKTPVNTTTLGASKERVVKPTPLSVETTEVSDQSLDNATTTQSETSKKITKRPLTPFFPRKKKSQENCPNASTDDSLIHDLNQKDQGEKQQQSKNQHQHHKENEQQQHQQKQQEQKQQEQQHLQQHQDKQQQHQHKQQQQNQQQQQQQQHQKKQQERQQQLPSQQQGKQDEPQSITPFVFQGKERPKLKPVHRLPDVQLPPDFSTRTAVLQAQFSLNQPSQSPKTARKQKPVQGDAQMEKFKLIQKNDSTAKKSDCCAMNLQDSSVTVTHCVAPWAIVCDKMPDQLPSDTPKVGKKVKCKTSKTSHREGHGFFSKIFGKKTTTKKNKPKHDCSKRVSAELERLTQNMQDLRLSSSTSIHQDDATKYEAGSQITEVTPISPEQEPDLDSESTVEDSDSSTDLEPPSCVEAWEIAEDVVEKALFLLPVPTAGKYVVPDSPFEPEFVKRLVADALEAKRGLKKVKEDQQLMEKFRDALLKFFEDKEISDVIPPCNHPPGTNQCNLQPVIQPLVDILRQVLHEPKIANDQPKNELETQREAKRQTESQQPLPRKYIKVRRRLKTGQAPTQLLIRFCQACGDTRQPDGRKLMSCGRCKDVVYCSKECQGVDWITHKFTCRGGDRRGYCKHHGT